MYGYCVVKWGCLISLCPHFLSFHCPLLFKVGFPDHHPSCINTIKYGTGRIPPLSTPVTGVTVKPVDQSPGISPAGIIKPALIMDRKSSILMSGAINRNHAQWDMPMNPRYYLYYPQSTVLWTGSPHTTIIFTRLTHAH